MNRGVKLKQFQGPCKPHEAKSKYPAHIFVKLLNLASPFRWPHRLDCLRPLSYKMLIYNAIQKK